MLSLKSGLKLPRDHERCDIERNCPDRGGYSAICTYSHITKAHCIPGLYSLLRSFYASFMYASIAAHGKRACEPSRASSALSQHPIQLGGNGDCRRRI